MSNISRRSFLKGAGVAALAVAAAGVLAGCCKVCSVDKDLLELEKIKPGQREAMCNPKVQARLLNEGGTELNFIVGLCVGHDMLFTMESKVPVSSIITKDRVLANNPAGAVYSRYWRRKLGILEEGTV